MRWKRLEGDEFLPLEVVFSRENQMNQTSYPFWRKSNEAHHEADQFAQLEIFFEESQIKQTSWRHWMKQTRSDEADQLAPLEVILSGED